MIERTFNRSQVSELFDIYKDYLGNLSEIQATRFLGNSRLSHINSSLALSYEGSHEEKKYQVVEHLTNCFPSVNFQNMLRLHFDSIDMIDKKRFRDFLLNCQKDGVDIVTPLEREIADKSTQDRKGINFLMDSLFHVTTHLPQYKKASHAFQLAHNYSIEFNQPDTKNRLKQASYIIDYLDYPEAQKFINSPHHPDFVKDYMTEKINAKTPQKAISISSDIEDYYLVNFTFKHHLFSNDNDEKIHQYMTARLVQNLCEKYLPLDKDFNAEISAGNKNPEIGSVISFVTKEKSIQEELKTTLQIFNDNMYDLAEDESETYIEFCDNFDKKFTVCKLQTELSEKNKSSKMKI